MCSVIIAVYVKSRVPLVYCALFTNKELIMWTALPSICELVPAVKPLVRFLFVSVHEALIIVRLCTCCLSVAVVLYLKCHLMSVPVSVFLARFERHSV
jgi:hypothetical protein